MRKLVIYSVIALGILALLVFQGFVVSSLWGWFVVPLGMPAIGTWHGLGLALLLALVTHQFTRVPESEVMQQMSHEISRPFLAWGIGAVVHFWCM